MRARLVLLLALLLVPCLSQATTYYTNAASPVNNVCGAAVNVTTPTKTIAAGAACLTPGDTLIIKGGTYVEVLYGTLPSGTSSAPITVQAAPGETVLLQPTHAAWVAAGTGIEAAAIGLINTRYLTLDGLVLDLASFDVWTISSLSTPVNMGIYVAGGSDHITIKRMEIKNVFSSTAPGGLEGNAVFSHPSTSFITVQDLHIHDISVGGNPQHAGYGWYMAGHDQVGERNHIHDVGAYGYHMYDNSPNNTNNILRNNRIHNTGNSGILMGAGVSSLAYNNVIYQAGGDGFMLGYDATNFALYNNTIYNCGGVAVRIRGGEASGTIVRNNIFRSNSGGDGISNGGTGTVQDHNLLGTDPLFVNAAGADFHLQAGSPAINTGTNTTCATTDLDGATRPVAICDEGAYEFGGTPPAPTLEAWWKADEGVGTTLGDATGHAHTGTLQTGATFAPGRVGVTGVGFNGSTGYVAVPGLLGTPASVTLELWLRVPTAPPGGAGILVTLGDYVTLYLNATQLFLYYWDGSAYHTLPLTQSLVDSQWHHVVGVVAPSQTLLRLYVDGQQKATDTPTAAIAYSGVGTGTVLGAFHDGTKYYVSGTLDEVRVYSYALTPADVTARYQTTARLPRHGSGGLR